MKLLFNEGSFRDEGTLYHLKVVLNRKAVTFHNNKINDFNACEDFVKLVINSHIVAAAMEILNMSSKDDVPSNTDRVLGCSEGLIVCSCCSSCSQVC